MRHSALPAVNAAEHLKKTGNCPSSEPQEPNTCFILLTSVRICVSVWPMSYSIPSPSTNTL